MCKDALAQVINMGNHDKTCGSAFMTRAHIFGGQLLSYKLKFKIS